MAIDAAMSVLSPKVGGSGRPVDWTLNPDAPIPFAFGRVGVAGTVIHKRTFGPDKMYYGFVSVLSGAGPIDGFEAFTADDFSVTFNAQGKAVTSEWRDEMWRATRLGAQPDTFLPTPTGLKNNAVLPNWASGHRASGKALSMLIMGENSKRTAYPNGEVKPLEVIRGLKCWDPRQDSTYPGGSGACRLDNPATWVFSQNPIICALKWCLGLWEDPIGKGTPHVGQQVGGIGSKLAGIDVPAFIAAANVCDANGWTCAAYPNTDDDKHQVLVSFFQAGGAIYSQRAGKISLIQRAAPRTSVATITADDVIGAIEVDTAASRIDRINTIQPTYWSPQHRWQMTALPEVTAQAYRDQDGGKRSRGVTYHYVTNANQAAQLAALDIAHARESMAGQVALKPHLQRIQPGDVFTISEPGFLLDGVKCLCMNTEYDPAEAVVRVTFISETDAKYPFALGQSTVPPVPPTLVAPVNEVSPPFLDDWQIVVRPIVPGQPHIPGFDLTGVVSNATAHRVVVEYALAAEGPWTQAYSGPPTTDRIEINVQPNTEYWIAVSYYNAAGLASQRTVYGPFLSDNLIAGDVTHIAGRTVEDILADIENAGTGVNVDELISEAEGRITELLDEANALLRGEILSEAQARTLAIAQEAAARIAEIQAEREARGEDIAEVLNEVDVVRTDLSAEVTARNLQISAVEDAITVVDQNLRTYADGLVAEASLNFTTTAAFNDALSATLSSANSYADGIKTYADQTFATTSALNNGLAGTLTAAKTYTDELESWAEQRFVTSAALGAANAATLSSARSYADGIKTNADQTFATTVALNSGLAGTLSQARAYTDELESYATQNFVTSAALGTANANTLSAARSYTDGEISEATQTLATKAERANGDASTLSTARSYTDALRSDASQVYATQSTLNGVSANASLALSTAVAANGAASAVIGVTTNVNGVITGTTSVNNGTTTGFRVQADLFQIVPSTAGAGLTLQDRLFMVQASNGQRVFELTW